MCVSIKVKHGKMQFTMEACAFQMLQIKTLILSYIKGCVCVCVKGVDILFCTSIEFTLLQTNPKN